MIIHRQFILNQFLLNWSSSLTGSRQMTLNTWSGDLCLTRVRSVFHHSKRRWQAIEHRKYQKTCELHWRSVCTIQKIVVRFRSPIANGNRTSKYLFFTHCTPWHPQNLCCKHNSLWKHTTKPSNRLKNDKKYLMNRSTHWSELNQTCETWSVLWFLWRKRTQTAGWSRKKKKKNVWYSWKDWWRNWKSKIECATTEKQRERKHDADNIQILIKCRKNFLHLFDDRSIRKFKKMWKSHERRLSNDILRSLSNKLSYSCDWSQWSAVSSFELFTLYISWTIFWSKLLQHYSWSKIWSCCNYFWRTSSLFNSFFFITAHKRHDWWMNNSIFSHSWNSVTERWKNMNCTVRPENITSTNDADVMTTDHEASTWSRSDRQQKMNVMILWRHKMNSTLWKLQSKSVNQTQEDWHMHVHMMIEDAGIRSEEQHTIRADETDQVIFDAIWILQFESPCSFRACI